MMAGGHLNFASDSDGEATISSVPKFTLNKMAQGSDDDEEETWQPPKLTKKNTGFSGFPMSSSNKVPKKPIVSVLPKPAKTFSTKSALGDTSALENSAFAKQHGQGELTVVFQSAITNLIESQKQHNKEILYNEKQSTATLIENQNSHNNAVVEAINKLVEGQRDLIDKIIKRNDKYVAAIVDSFQRPVVQQEVVSVVAPSSEDTMKAALEVIEAQVIAKGGLFTKNGEAITITDFLQVETIASEAE